MKETIQLDDERKILIDTNLVTVGSRRLIRSKILAPAPVKLIDNSVILKELADKYKETPPTPQIIYEGFLSLLDLGGDAIVDEKANQDLLESELCRICCRWVKKNGTPGEVLTDDEFSDLPYDAGVHIAGIVFSKNSKGFLVVPPQSK